MARIVGWDEGSFPGSFYERPVLGGLEAVMKSAEPVE
jgi:hypothetical protein